MLKNNQHITSCTITWESFDDILCVVTCVLPKEIQVRFYSVCDLMYGKIWPLDDQSKQILFDILNKCLDDWDGDNYASDAADSGTVKAPNHKKPIKIETAKRKGISLENCKTGYNLPQWKLGFTTAIPLSRNDRHNTALEIYVTKYITKDLQKIFGRFYFSGGNG